MCLLAQTWLCIYDANASNIDLLDGLLLLVLYGSHSFYIFIHG